MTKENQMVERVARALMLVNAARPGNQLGGLAIPVLSLDPDFDDLPMDNTEGTEDDDITQEAVMLLARAAIEAMLIPTQVMCDEGGWVVPGERHNPKMAAAIWNEMIHAALQVPEPK